MLTGGTAARMGGVAKADLVLDGVTFLERSLAAVAAADEVVVVGTPTTTSVPVVWAMEDPPGGGPAAGLLAGVAALSQPVDLLVVLAVDMPFVTAATVARLVDAAAAEGADGGVLVDGDARRQLAAAYRRAALQRSGEAFGLSMHALVDGLRLASVPAVGDEARDVDRWADLGPV